MTVKEDVGTTEVVLLLRRKAATLRSLEISSDGFDGLLSGVVGLLMLCLRCSR